jgi:hypothetical protein
VNLICILPYNNRIQADTKSQCDFVPVRNALAGFLQVMRNEPRSKIQS